MEQRNFSDSSNDFKISKFIRDLNQDILSKNDIKQRINLLLEIIISGIIYNFVHIFEHMIYSIISL